MNKSRARAVITVLLVAAAIMGVSVAFIANATTYVTVSEARKSGATNVYLKGTLIKDSIVTDVRSGTLTFRLKDKDGEEATVVYTGSPVMDMEKATEVAAQGVMKDEKFYSEKLLIKCPSKYEGAQKTKT
jgi:cytochrome c-type biogenesis protein CcmE